MARRWFAFLLIIFCNIACAKSTHDYYQLHAKGWHWYDDPKQKETTEASDPVANMNAVRATIQRALAKAVLEPTPENVKHYIAAQNQLSNQANQFANTWQQVLLAHPKLDHSLQHPTNAVSTHVYYGEQHQAQDAAIAKLAQESGLFFFYKSNCPYCQKFAPIIKAFANEHHLTLIPITMDGISLPEFPNSFVDKGQSQTFHVQVEPSLFAVNPYTHKAYPVAYGLVSQDTLRQRIFDIATQFRGQN